MPFSAGEFFALFGVYNTAIWPLQIVAYLAGLLVVAMLFRPSQLADRVILLVLAAMWSVNGVGYHLLHFAPINPAARVFAVFFLLEAILLAAAPFRSRDRIVFDIRPGPNVWLAAALILYAMLLYPLLGFLFGHRYPEVPMFGVAPCPTTIFTIGVLMLGRWQVVRWLLIVPALWSVVGGSAAILLSVPQDYGLIVAGVIVLAYSVTRRRPKGA